MKVYKLTDANHETYNQTKWRPGLTHHASGEGALCDQGWLHWYYSPELAPLMNPAHGRFNPDDMVLWEAEAAGAFADDHGLKGGSTSLTMIKIIELPICTTEHRIRFAIACASKVCRGESFLSWAAGWLCGSNRSSAAAWKAWDSGCGCAGAYASASAAWAASASACACASASACASAAWDAA
jgi:hypothetical protein